MFWKSFSDISANNKLLLEPVFLGLTNLWLNSIEAALEKESKLDPITALDQQVTWIIAPWAIRNLEEYVIQFQQCVPVWYSHSGFAHPKKTTIRNSNTL